LIGFFVNTLVLRAKFDEDPSFTDLLAQVRTTCLDAYMHQDVPFEKLVEELQPERSLSHTPLFQVMFVLQNMLKEPAGSNAAASGLQLEVVESENRTAKFDLTLVMEEVGDELAAGLEYNTDLFDASTMERLLEQFEHLLMNIVNQPDLAVSRLELLNPAEEQQMLRAWNNTAREYDVTGGMHRLFEAQAEQTPTATALVFGDERLSYRELNERANSLAHQLVQHGVKSEDRVGILMERSAAMVISMLAVLKAGGCYVPLDPQYPSERLEFMQADAGLCALLTTRAVAAACEVETSQVIYVDEVEQGAT
jgi:non-ribosomal peptide synthetase component F